MFTWRPQRRSWLVLDCMTAHVIHLPETYSTLGLNVTLTSTRSAAMSTPTDPFAMTPCAQRLDFSAQSPGLAKHYNDFYAVIIDDAFSSEECRALINLASESGPWSPAGVSAHAEVETVHTEFRNSGRILYFDDATAGRIYDRLYPLVNDIHEIAPTGQWSSITGKGGRKAGPSWRLVGYASSNYFKYMIE